MVNVVGSNKVTDLKSAKQFGTNRNDEQTFHDSLKSFVAFSQLLGVLPQENICGSLKELHFRWRSWRVWYALVIITSTLTGVVFCLMAWFRNGFRFEEFVTLVFHAGSAISLILYLRLATSWSKLMTSWCRMDKIMNFKYGYPENLNIRLRIVIIVFLLFSSAEYSLNSNNRYFSLKHVLQDRYKFEKYYETLFPQFFIFMPINISSIMYTTFLTIHSSIIWAFNDLFIILMSIGLALRFKQINSKLEKCYKKEQTERFWREIREDYDRLSILCKELDDHISYIVLLTYFLNMFFLLVQLYNSLQSVQGTYGKIYLVFSFIYLFLKIISVSLYAAWINDESLEPAPILNSVSSALYNMEIKRLLLQIDFDNVVLTGCRMFRVKRGIILSIAGAIVTYELVLIQFNIATNVKL